MQRDEGALDAFGFELCKQSFIKMQSGRGRYDCSGMLGDELRREFKIEILSKNCRVAGMEYA